LHLGCNNDFLQKDSTLSLTFLYQKNSYISSNIISLRGSIELKHKRKGIVNNK
jgi:hypothetical protein